MEIKQKILIIRFSSIGDIVLTSPVLRCLRDQKKEIEIHYLVKKQFLSVLTFNPNMDVIHEYQGDFRNTITELKKENFSQIIDLQNNIRSNRIKRRLKIPTSTVNKLNFRKWLYVAFKINNLPKKHIVDRYFECLKSLGVKNDLKGLEYFSEPKAKEILNELPEPMKNGYIVAVTGAAHFTKQIPNSILETILNGAKLPVVFTGNTTDKNKAKSIIKNLKVPYFNACGACTLGETAEIIRNAKVILTPDTGAMHIAAAFNRPTISLWGNTVPDFGMFSYMPKNEELYYIAEVKNLKCRPCSKIGYKQCPKEHFKCMNDQNCPEIIGKLIEFWNISNS